MQPRTSFLRFAAGAAVLAAAVPPQPNPPTPSPPPSSPLPPPPFPAAWPRPRTCRRCCGCRPPRKSARLVKAMVVGHTGPDGEVAEWLKAAVC